MSLVMTKAAIALKNAEENFEVIKFKAHKPAKKSNLPGSKDSQEKAKNVIPEKGTDLKKIRYDVIKFGMQGFEGRTKEEARIALAVSLGAKPPKKEFINYKVLMEKRKQEKRTLIEDKELMHSKTVLHSVGKSKSKKRSSKGNDVGHLLSSYGKIQKKEVDKLRKQKKKGKK